MAHFTTGSRVGSLPCHTSTSAPVVSVDTDAPPCEAYQASLTRRLALVAALLGQASDTARSPIARREAARLATSTLGAATALLNAWRDEIAYSGEDLSSWAGATAEDFGDELARAHARLALVVAALPAAAPRLASPALPLSPARRVGGAP